MISLSAIYVELVALIHLPLNNRCAVIQFVNRFFMTLFIFWIQRRIPCPSVFSNEYNKGFHRFILAGIDRNGMNHISATFVFYSIIYSIKNRVSAKIYRGLPSLFYPYEVNFFSRVNADFTLRSALNFIMDFGQ